jgi:hypothetical protein
MERPEVNLKKPILWPITGHRKDISREEYVKLLEEFERRCESSLIETFKRVNVKAKVKTDPYSLPFTHEFVVTLKGESYTNGAYEFYRVARRIVKEVLNKNLYTFRFYLFINPITEFEKPTLLNSFGAVEYRFRYYLKEEKEP